MILALLVVFEGVPAGDVNEADVAVVPHHLV